MLDFNKYRNPDPYRSKPRKPLLKHGHTSQDAEKYLGLLKAYEKEIIEWKNHMAERSTKEAELIEQFYIDMYEDLGISENPKRHKLSAIAWNMGHSSGLSEVYHYASELVTLIED